MLIFEDNRCVWQPDVMSVLQVFSYVQVHKDTYIKCMQSFAYQFTSINLKNLNVFSCIFF